jgi:hypothetical protein
MSDVDQVIAAAEMRAAALAGADAERLTGLLHDQFVWTTHTRRRLTRDDYVARNTGGSTVWRSQNLDGAEVAVVADTAVLRANAIDIVVVGGKDESFRMPMTQVWVREDARWRCLAGHAGPRRGVRAVEGVG